MASDDLRHLNQLHAEERSKYAYFLLAATGASLGYGLQKIDTSLLTPSAHIGLAAVAMWMASFFCGCCHITTVQSSIFLNFILVQLKGGDHPRQPSSEQEMEIAWQVTTEALERKNRRAQIYSCLQFWLLSVGVLLFAGWRVIDLLERSLGTPKK